MGPCHHCRAEKGEPSGACKCRVVRILSNSEMCDKFGLKTKETSWPYTDYRSCVKSLNMLLLLQGKGGTKLGGAAVPWNLTCACCKVTKLGGAAVR